MQIQQLQVASDPLQDRLLLRISTSGKEEIRVFVTRRFLRELWPALMGMLFGHLGARPLPAAASQSPGGNFSQPYANDNPNFPLGSAPILAMEANLEPAGQGLCKLTLRELKERGFTLNLNTDLFQALCAMLRAGSEQARWDLPLEYAAPSAPADAPPAAKTRLH